MKTSSSQKWSDISSVLGGLPCTQIFSPPLMNFLGNMYKNTSSYKTYRHIPHRLWLGEWLARCHSIPENSCWHCLLRAKDEYEEIGRSSFCVRYDCICCLSVGERSSCRVLPWDLCIHRSVRGINDDKNVWRRRNYSSAVGVQKVGK